MRPNCSAVLLAGGLSRRMGRDKAFLPWGQTTLIEHVIETLRPVVDELIVAVRDARAFTRLQARVVEDCVSDAHALGGLYTGLRAASHEWCFVCACDAPFLNPRLIHFLIEQADGYELVIPKTAQGLEPLHAVYAKSALRVIEEQLRHQHWDLKALVPKLRTRVVESETIHQFDPEELSFFNVNIPEDYVAASTLRQLNDSHHGRPSRRCPS